MAKSPTNRHAAPPPPKAPTATAEGAKRIEAITIQAFDRKDGSGVDWRLMTDSLFRAAFQQLDNLPADVRLRMAERVHAAAYERVLSTEAARGGGGFSGPDAGDIRPGTTSPAIAPQQEPSPT